MREVSLPSTRFSSFERLRQPPSGCFISVGVKTNGGEGVKEKGIHKRGGEMEKTGKEELLTLQKRSGKGRDSLLSSFFSCRSPSFLNTHFCVSFRKKWVPLTLLRGRCLRTSKCLNKMKRKEEEGGFFAGKVLPFSFCVLRWQSSITGALPRRLPPLPPSRNCVNTPLPSSSVSPKGERQGRKLLLFLWRKTGALFAVAVIGGRGDLGSFRCLGIKEANGTASLHGSLGCCRKEPLQ